MFLGSPHLTALPFSVSNQRQKNIFGVHAPPFLLKKASQHAERKPLFQETVESSMADVRLGGSVGCRFPSTRRWVLSKANIGFRVLLNKTHKMHVSVLRCPLKQRNTTTSILVSAWLLQRNHWCFFLDAPTFRPPVAAGCCSGHFVLYQSAGQMRSLMVLCTSTSIC